MISPHSGSKSQSLTAYLGLAPFLRMSIAGKDLRPICNEMLGQLSTADGNSEEAYAWMNLSTVMLCLGQRGMGLVFQAQALAVQRIYHIAASRQPAKLRLLMIVAPGDLSANTPLDCLLEGSDIDLQLYYATPDAPLPSPVPEHDALIVAVGESDGNRDILVALEHALVGWSKPIVNAPRNILTTARQTASMLLQNIAGLLMPPTLRVSRESLADIASDDALPARLHDCDFPIIVRPVDSHAGQGLERLAGAVDLASYLARVSRAEYFVSRFIDYSGDDGLFRKFRIALVAGKPFACHMAISSNWMVHYVNAGMYDDAGKRAEEAHFMAHFDQFARRHESALAAIHQRTQLDYLCIDCAETRDRQLLVFEIDHAMVVHAMDSEALFPHKQHHMQTVQEAFRDLLVQLTVSTCTSST